MAKLFQRKDAKVEKLYKAFKDCPALKEFIIPAGSKAKFVELGIDENLLVEK